MVPKALAFDGRGENKDAYDLFHVIRNHGGGIRDVVDRLPPLLDDHEAIKAVDVLRRDFTDPDALGSRRVAEFVTGGPNFEIQADVVGFVSRLPMLLDESTNRGVDYPVTP